MDYLMTHAKREINATTVGQCEKIQQPHVS